MASRFGRRLMRVALGAGLVIATLGGVASRCESIPATRGWLDEVRGGFRMPAFAAIRRDLPMGTHPYLAVLPGAARSPAMARVEPDPVKRETLLNGSRVRIAMTPDYAHIDDEAGVIVVSWWYYHLGADLHLYLDMLHELTHLRQLRDGADLWDASRTYAQRPTEIEGYCVAVEEGRRLGMSPAEVREHVHNPWMTDADVDGLLAAIDRMTASAPAPAPAP